MAKKEERVERVELPQQKDYAQRSNTDREQAKGDLSAAFKDTSVASKRPDFNSLPASYPDCAPDMFYALPWLRLVGSQRFPNAADVSMEFRGQSWQRWSLPSVPAPLSRSASPRGAAPARLS